MTEDYRIKQCFLGEKNYYGKPEEIIPKSMLMLQWHANKLRYLYLYLHILKDWNVIQYNIMGQNIIMLLNY